MTYFDFSDRSELMYEVVELVYWDIELADEGFFLALVDASRLLQGHEI